MWRLICIENCIYIVRAQYEVGASIYVVGVYTMQELFCSMMRSIDRLQFCKLSFTSSSKEHKLYFEKTFFIGLCAQVWHFNIFRKKLLLIVIAAWYFIHTSFQNHHVKITSWSLFSLQPGVCFTPWKFNRMRIKMSEYIYCRRKFSRSMCWYLFFV